MFECSSEFDKTRHSCNVLMELRFKGEPDKESVVKLSVFVVFSYCCVVVLGATQPPSPAPMLPLCSENSIYFSLLFLMDASKLTEGKTVSEPLF